MNRRFATLLCLLLVSIATLRAAFPQVKLQLVCEHQVHSPVAMVAPGDGSGRMFIVDQRGKIRIFRNGMLEPGAFLDLGPKLVTERPGFDERGLLGLAFHPGYATPASPGYRRFYVFYIAASPQAPGTTADPIDSRTVVAEFQVAAANSDVADPASERVLLTFDKPQFNHAGGGMSFGPDGRLYFSVGDGGSSQDNAAGHTGGSGAKPTNAKGNAQDLTKMLGKIHRIDPLGTNGPGGQYGIPADNPFASSPGGERPEIYAYGLRNTWRFSFDSRPGGTNRLFAADVGQGEVEEIDLIVKGGNYGWRNKEGSFVPSFSVNAPAMANAAMDPIAQYAHPGVVKGSPPLQQLGISCTGGYVYRGSAIPGLVGKYIFADFSESFAAPRGVMLGLEETSPGVFALQALDVLGGNPIGGYVQSFGQDEQGELYVLTRRTLPVSAPDPATGLPSGKIYKIVPVPTTSSVILSPVNDTTIYSDVEFGNGAGPTLFAGTIVNSPAHRRALLKFDFGSLPPEATVASAALTLSMDKTIAGSFPFSLHKLTRDWGEGTANAGSDGGGGAFPGGNDATWNKPFFGQSAGWDSPGGDFLAAKSASLNVGALGNYTWTGARLAYDINDWLAAPLTRFGWVLKAENEGRRKDSIGLSGQTTLTVPDTEGLADNMTATGPGIGFNARIAAGGVNSVSNEVTLTVPHSNNVVGQVSFSMPSAKRFVSKESANVNSRPKLTLNYVAAPVLTRRESWEKQHFFTGEFISDTADTEGDGLTNAVEYAWGFSPKTRNEMSDGLSVNSAGLASGTPVTITFRRDPLATDVTYQLQGSSDLVNWTTLTQSVAGGAPTGLGFQSEAEIPGQTPFRNVIVIDTAPAGPKRFFRLKVMR